ncbi:MAG: ribosomal-processing cysteine protease Prp [Chitinophagales bacterium]
MVTIEILKDSEDSTVAFRVEGHAGFGESGEDIICAGVSAVTQTALVGLLKYLDKKPVHQRKPGLLACSLPEDLGHEDAQKAKFILGTMEEGLKEIEHSHGEFVELVIRRC